MDLSSEKQNVMYKRDTVYPKKHFWCGFDETGRQKWFIELSNNRIISSKDENYFFWLKKYTTNERHRNGMEHTNLKSIIRHRIPY